MDNDVLIENEDAFWEELDDVVSTPCRSHDRIDDTLRTWLELSAKYREEYLQGEDEIARCSLTLLDSDLYTKHSDYVRRQFIHGLLQEDDTHTLHVVSAFLLYDGRRNESTFELMNVEGVFSKLVELIKESADDGVGLHRRLLELLYEMSRIQRLSWDDLNLVDDGFVLYLFRIIECLSSDVNDPYHYPVIRVLLVLNEQYMVFAHSPSSSSRTNGAPINNRVIKVLSTHGNAYKTFGENIILLLNRESETSLQLLILKLLYLLFTTESTREYFYTNDLHVLVDILIRNLLDLPADAVLSPTTGQPSRTSSLRHTYLRVLYPLLARTQLAQPPHYKRDQLRKTLFLLANVGHSHFDRPDDTTVRLVGRCVTVEWLKDDEEEIAEHKSTMVGRTWVEPGNADEQEIRSPSEAEQNIRAGHAVVAKKLLGMGLREAQESNLSLVEVTAQTEKPGVLTPSKRDHERTRKESEASVLESEDSNEGEAQDEGNPFGDD